MGNTKIKETLAGQEILENLRIVLGENWDVDFVRSANGLQETLTLKTPIQQTFEIPVLYQPGYQTPSTLKNSKEVLQQMEGEPVLIADYFSPLSRQKMQEEGISGADSSGWISIGIFTPYPLVIRAEGQQRKPTQTHGQVKIQRLNGASASRVIRTLLNPEIQLPLGVRQLANQAEVSPGTISKILPTLEQEDAVQRDEQGAVISINRASLLERWAQDIKPFPSRAKAYFYPRDLNLLRKKASSYAVQETGLSVIADALNERGEHPLLPANAFHAYTAEDIDVLATKLRLREVPAKQANVFLAPMPHGITDKLPISQALADLASIPGREKEVAQQFLEFWN